MLNTILGVAFLFLGFFGLIMSYKNRYKIDITAIFFKKDKYEVINKEKFLRVQNIKSLFLDISFIFIGALGLWWTSEVYIFAAIILGASNYIFAAVGEKYVRLIPKASL